MESRAWWWPGGKASSIALHSTGISASRSIRLTWKRRSPRASARERTRNRCQLWISSRQGEAIDGAARLQAPRMEAMTMSSESDLHHIVVVGGGAGGLELVTRLGDRLAAKGKA